MCDGRAQLTVLDILGLVAAVPVTIAANAATGTNFTHAQLDVLLVAYQVIPRLRDAFLVVSEALGNPAGIAFGECGYGLAALIGACWSISPESGEHYQGDYQVKWTCLISCKFLTNAMSALDSCLVFEDVLPDSPVREDFAAARMAMQFIEGVGATALGKVARPVLSTATHTCSL